MWTQFVLRLSDVHIWDTWTINTDEQLTNPCVFNYTSGYKSMRKVVQCIPLKTMAALAVLEDTVSGAIGRKHVLRDRGFAGTWWQLAHQPFWGQSSWNCAQSWGRRWSATQRGAMLCLCHRLCAHWGLSNRGIPEGAGQPIGTVSVDPEPSHASWVGRKAWQS